MDVVIAGGHGKIGRRLTRLLAARNDRVGGIIRNPDHRDDVSADGGEPIVCDLETASEGEVDAAVAGADAIVFAAGAGPGSGPDRKNTVDYGAAKRLVDAELGAAGLDHTIVRPGGLTDDAGNGTVRIDRHVPPGQVTRDDVAAVLAAVLVEPGTVGRTFEVVEGDTPIAAAVAAVEAHVPVEPR
jgi:uncharacterized protein YbjT (DUF2867 family)